MRIQQIAGAGGARLVENAFGFAAAEPRPIGLGSFSRRFALGALFKSFQIDHIPHSGLHHSAGWERAAFSLTRGWFERGWSRLAITGSVVIQKSSYTLIAGKNMFCSAKTYFLLY